MHMQVKNFLTPMFASVYDEPVTVIGDAFLVRNFGSNNEIILAQSANRVSSQFDLQIPIAR